LNLHSRETLKSRREVLAGGKAWSAKLRAILFSVYFTLYCIYTDSTYCTELLAELVPMLC